MKEFFVIADVITLGSFAHLGGKMPIELDGIPRIAAHRIGLKKALPLRINAMHQIRMQRVILEHTKAGAMQALAKLRRRIGRGEINDGENGCGTHEDNQEDDSVL